MVFDRNQRTSLGFENSSCWVVTIKIKEVQNNSLGHIISIIITYGPVYENCFGWCYFVYIQLKNIAYQRIDLTFLTCCQWSVDASPIVAESILVISRTFLAVTSEPQSEYLPHCRIFDNWYYLLRLSLFLLPITQNTRSHSPKNIKT